MVEIVTFKKDEYQPEAIAAAQAELSFRKINPETFFSEEEVKAIEQDSSLYRETESLSKIQIALMIVFPALFITGWALFFRLFPAIQILNKLGFPAIALAYYLTHKWLKTNAYERKAKEFKN